MKNFIKSVDARDVFPGLTQSIIKSNEIKVAIAIAVMNKRQQLNLSQQQYAELLGVSQALIARWEKGTHNFTIDTLCELAEKTGLDLKVQLDEPEQKWTCIALPTEQFYSSKMLFVG